MEENFKLRGIKDYKSGKWITKGKTYEVKDGFITFDDGFKTAYCSDTMLSWDKLSSYFELVKEEELKVGDMVIVNDGFHGSKIFNNSIGKIIVISNCVYGIEFNKYINGHNCDGIGKDGYCFYIIKEFVKPYLSNKSIHITSDGKTTTAVLKDGKNVIKRAESNCCPTDEFNFEYGVMLAIDRLFDKDDRVVEVKRLAEVGEYVKVITTYGHKAKIGTIGKVEDVDLSHYIHIFANEKRHCLNPENYVVLENYKEDSFVPKTLKNCTNDELIEEMKSRMEK